MPDTVNLVLVLLVGVAVGVFFTLVFDSSFLTKRVQEEKNQQFRLENQIILALASIESLKKKLTEAQNRMAYMRLGGKENLTLIRGIGPAYARRLQEAGIRTLSVLAETSPDQLCEILQIKPWQNAAPREWVAEAKQLAAVFADEEE